MLLPRKLSPYILLGLLLSLVLSLGSFSGGFLPGSPVQAAPVLGTPPGGLSLTQGVTQTVLENGLTVLTKEVHTAPVVTVQIWYRVGSRNEGGGESGLSHQLEHLLFKGTTNRPIQFGRLFSALGSQFNAFTSYDQTAYVGTVERNKAVALLTLEADRMKNSLNGEEQLTSEKRVVISELQGYENSPNYRLNRAVMRATFPDRAYGLPVGGTKSDVEKFTVEQVRNYYQTYYSPNNATLVIVGDFATEPMLQQVKQIFGPLTNQSPLGATSSRKLFAAAEAIQPVQPPAPITLKEPGSVPFLQLVYPLPNLLHPDVPAIDVMDSILTGGRSARLYQALVESGLASSVGANAAELIEPGWYSIYAVAAQGQELPKINQKLQQVLADLQSQPVGAEELNQAKTQLRAAFILDTQDIPSQANQLGYSQTVTGTYTYPETYLAAVAKVTAADVQRVAQTYLNPAKQTQGFFEPTLPGGKPGTSSTGVGRTAENFNPGEPVDPAEVARYLPPITASTAPTLQTLPERLSLPNGLQVLLMPDPTTPTLTLRGQIEAGTVFDSGETAGLANLTAANLMNGTQTKPALVLAKTLEERGASLSFGASREGVSIASNALSADLPLVIQTLADVLQNATFPADQLELSRQRALNALKSTLDDPWSLGIRVFQQAIYPANHPFYKFPTAESFQRITRQDVLAFYKAHYRPDTTTLVLVGDFDPGQVRSLLTQILGSWPAPGQPPVLDISPVALPQTITRLQKVIPGKAEAVTYLGYRGISRRDPRYYAALVMNQILGGDTLASRLGTEVRDRQGLTYGIYSAFAAGKNPGPFLIQMQTAPNDTEKAVASTLELLKQFRAQGVTEAELNAAKRSITNSYPVDLASPRNLSSVILSNLVYGLDAEELRRFPDRIKAVTMADVQQAIQDLIHPESLVIVTAGPGETAR